MMPDSAAFKLVKKKNWKSFLVGTTHIFKTRKRRLSFLIHLIQWKWESSKSLADISNIQCFNGCLGMQIAMKMKQRILCNQQFKTLQNKRAGWQQMLTKLHFFKYKHSTEINTERMSMTQKFVMCIEQIKAGEQLLKSRLLLKLVIKQMQRKGGGQKTKKV